MKFTSMQNTQMRRELSVAPSRSPLLVGVTIRVHGSDIVSQPETLDRRLLLCDPAEDQCFRNCKLILGGHRRHHDFDWGHSCDIDIVVHMS